MTNIDRIKVLREIRDKNLGVAGEDLGFKHHFTNREMEALNWAIMVFAIIIHNRNFGISFCFAKR